MAIGVRRSTERYLAAREPAADEAGRRLRESSAYLGQHMGEVPVLVLACIEVAQPWEAGESQAGLWGSLLPAAWSYMLSARSRGLGTAWTTLHLRYEKEVAALLGLPGDIRQGVLIPTAYYTGETFRPAPAAPSPSTKTTGNRAPASRPGRKRAATRASGSAWLLWVGVAVGGVPVIGRRWVPPAATLSVWPRLRRRAGRCSVRLEVR